MVAEVPRLWRELVQALSRIDPAIPDNLYPGADDAVIERLRAGLHVALPAELEALYRANNGEGRLGLDYEGPALFWVPSPEHGTGRVEYYVMEIDGVDGVIAEFASLAAHGEAGWSVRRGPVCRASGGWIPFAKDFGGNFLCVDTDPDAGGTQGQIIEAAFDDGRLQIISRGLAEFLADLLARAQP